MGLSLSLGCGGSGPPPSASATGVVTHNGQPLGLGEIYFVSAENGYSANASITAEGKYEIAAGLPPAQYRVFVTRPRITADPMSGGAPPVAVEFPVPDRYQSESTSGLTAEVKAGTNALDFKLD